MYEMKNRRLNNTLKATFLASVALVASGCTADWSNERQATYNWTQNPPVQASLQDTYALGKKQFAEGLFGMALKSFRVALVQEPRSLDRLNAVAATYDKLGRFDLAERYYARALGIDPESVPTLNNIGYSFLMQNDHVSARYYLEQAAKVARAENLYTDIIGANLVSLDMAEDRGSTFASLQQPIGDEQAVASVDGMKSGAWREVHAIATSQDVAKVAAAGTMPDQAVSQIGASGSQDEVILVPAAFSGPRIEAAPVEKVDSHALVAKVESAAKAKATANQQLASPPEMLVEVSNGAGRRHLAARTRQFLDDEGITVGRLTNAESFTFATSTIFYRKGFGEKAREIAGLFPVPMELKAVTEQRAHVRILLGADSLDFDTMQLAEFKGY